ncbi:MAG: hypothetical protein V5A88_00220 [Candidatus Thermoplasmatota archaeon]
MASEDKSKEDAGDWFDELDAELEEKTSEVFRDLGERNSKMAELNRQFVKDFWRIWIRFEKLNVHFSMKPDHSSFARFNEFPEDWELREDFDFSNLNKIELMDKTQEDNRTGDSIVLEYYSEEDTLKIGLFFEYCEGEQYYKYSGWKRIFARYSLFDAEFPLDDDKMDEFHNKLKSVVKRWYESHLKRDRDIVLQYIEDEFEKIEEYPE